MSGVRLYCMRHRSVETATSVAAEALIYALSAALADEQTDPIDTYHDLYPDELLATWCPSEALAVLTDVEMYHEHVESLTEARRNHPSTDQEVER